MATKSQQIIDLYKAHPDWDYEKIAKEVKPDGSTKNTVQNILSKAGLLGGSKKSKAAKSSNGGISDSVFSLVVDTKKIDAQIKVLQRLKVDPLMEFAIEAGGIDAAVKQLNALKAKYEK